MTCARCKGPTTDVTEGARFWLFGPPIARAEYCPACTVDVDRKLPKASAP